MKAKILLVVFLMLASALVFVPSSVVGAPNFEWTHYDPAQDVLRIRTSGDIKFDSWPNVEITKMTSTFIDNTGIIPDQIQLTMMVQGTIQNDDAYKYVFVVLADGDEYIFAAYQNGQGIGFQMGSSNLILGVSATGENTNTLTITFNADSVSADSSFEFSGAAIYSEGDYLRYGDLATPDKLILITEPSDGSTVSGSNLQIKGVMMESIESQPSGDVKIEIDGTEYDVSDGDPWQYGPVDTTAMAAGEHTIRVFVEGSGLPNAEDTITITVDQDTGNYAFFDKKPPIHVSEYFEYEALGLASVSGIQIDVTNEMRTDVQTFEEVEVDGETYEAYKLYTHSEGTQNLGYIEYSNTLDRWSWRENGNFGTVRDHTVSTVDVTFRQETTVDTITEYDPPLEPHNNYAVTVGFINKWVTTPPVSASSTSKTIVGNDETENPPYSETFTVHGECLSYKQSHTVFGESFSDIFLIRTHYENPGISIVEYYSKDLGVPVQIDTYDTSRNLLVSLGLKDYFKVPFSVLIDDITFDPAQPKKDSAGKIIVSLRNPGEEEAADFDMILTDSGAQLSSQTISSVPAGETRDFTIDWTPKTEGNHTITITLEYQNTDLHERTEYVDVAKGDTSTDGIDPMILIIIALIAAVVAIVVVVAIIKKRGKPKEGEVPEAQVPQQAAQAPAQVGAVTIKAEPETVAAAPAAPASAAPAAAAGPQLITDTIQCPSCKNGFKVQYQSKPVRVKCPTCGTEGVLN